MEQVDYNEERQRQRKQYSHLTETVKYASACGMLGDSKGEQMALGHGVELMLDLLEVSLEMMGGEARHAVELDGVREVPRPVQDIQATGEEAEEGAPQAHVVPVVPGSVLRL